MTFFFLPPRLSFFIENPAEFPALALFAKTIPLTSVCASRTKTCNTPELFVTPAPSRVKPIPPRSVMI